MHSVTMDFLSLTTCGTPKLSSPSPLSPSTMVFCVVFQNQKKYPLAKNIAHLKDFPDTMDQSTDLRKKFESVLEFLSIALKVTRCLIEFDELPSQYVAHESIETATVAALIPSTVYLIIKSLLACASTSEPR